MVGGSVNNRKRGGLEEGFPKRKARRASGFCLGDGLSLVGITVRPLTEKVDVGMHPGEFCNRLMEREGTEDLARGRGGAMGAVKTGGACWRGQSGEVKGLEVFRSPKRTFVSTCSGRRSLGCQR